MEVLQFEDAKTVSDIIHEYNSTIKANSVPIIIDNGRY